LRIPCAEFVVYASLPKLRSAACPATRKRTVRPLLENLEDRVLLYSTYGGDWVNGSRITFSFAPDGTSIGGTPSVLFQTLNAKFTQANWQLQFQKAAAVWQAVANINLSQVSDDGSIEGCSGNQQDDPRFGDIRIFMINLGSGVLGETFLPPPFNGGTDAGDMLLNSAASWQINTDYDLETVAIHEFGHALGLGESAITSACMYAFYNGMKQSLTSDDIAGIQSIWGAPQPDQFNSNGLNNSSYTNPANITSCINSNDQIALPNLRLTSGSVPEWFTVTVPTNTMGTMVVTEQSTNLSMLSPDLYVYTSGLKLAGSSITTAYGATVSVSVTGVQPGQTFLIRAGGYAGGDPTGTYGLELNFGSQSQSPIPPPNTVVAQQPDQGSGSQLTYSQLISIGNVSGLGIVYSMNTQQGNSTKNSATSNSTTKTANVTQTTLGAAALVATASAQPALLTSGNAAVSNAASSPAVSASSLSPSALQALDDSLLTWRLKNPLSLFTKGNTTGSFLN